MKNPFENSKKAIKNTFLAGTVALGMLPTQNLDAQTTQGDAHKHTIQNLEQDHFEAGVSAKELKSILKGYDNLPGNMPLDMMLSSYQGNTFKVSEFVGQTEAAAQMQAQHELSKSGRVFSVGTFTKNLDNGNVSVIVIALEK